MVTRKLVVIDALAVLYRSFFAIRGLSTAAGQATNAVYGFVRLVRQLADAEHPTHWVVVFDGGLPARRMQLVPDYKAQRPSMPQDLRSQLPLVERYLEDSRIPWLRIEGEEADDVMASLSAWAEREGSDVRLATSDKDLYQVVSDKVRILSLGGKGLMGPAEVEDKMGVPPERVREWLALVGDGVDNIRGVDGVGSKTATALLKQFASMDDLWGRLSEIHSERIRTALETHRDIVERNLQMITLQRDIPFGRTWDDLAVREPDRARLLALFESLEFASLAREIREPTLF